MDQCFIDRALFHTELDLESVLFWLERARHIMDDGGDLGQIVNSIKSVISADLLILEDCKERAIVHYIDFHLPCETVNSYCLPGGLFRRLARIRFTHLFDNHADALKLFNYQDGRLAALIAVPMIRNDRPFGCLAAGFVDPMPFTSVNVMLLAIAAEIISMAGGLPGQKE
jgi:GAF domain-containing protein